MGGEGWEVVSEVSKGCESDAAWFGKTCFQWGLREHVFPRMGCSIVTRTDSSVEEWRRPPSPFFKNIF